MPGGRSESKSRGKKNQRRVKEKFLVKEKFYLPQLNNTIKIYDISSDTSTLIKHKRNLNYKSRVWPVARISARRDLQIEIKLLKIKLEQKFVNFNQKVRLLQNY